MKRSRILTALLVPLVLALSLVDTGQAKAAPSAQATMTVAQGKFAMTSGEDEPFSIKVAEPSDDGPHVGEALTEWWYFNVVNPTTKETFIVTLNSLPIATTSTFWYDRYGNKFQYTSATTAVAATNQPSACSNAGCFTYDASTNRYHLVYSFQGVSADIWFNDAKPGVTAGPSQYDGQWMKWTNPIATSNTSGWVWPATSPIPISVNNWRGYHDHNWGDFFLTDQTYRGWEWGGSHEPNGNAKVMGGVVDSYNEYHGVIAEVTASGTTYCKAEGVIGGPAMRLSNWTSSNGFAYPRTVKTACTSMGTLPEQTYTAGSTYIVDGAGLFKFSEALGSTVPGSVALVEHFRTKPFYGS